MDPSSWKEYGQIDPEFEGMLPHLPPPKSFADFGTAEDLRKAILEQMMQGIQAGIFIPVDWSGFVKEDLQIPTRDGQSIRAVRYGPASAKDAPLFVYFHGGGWTFGFPEAWESGCEVLVKELGFVVLSVDYRLAPENVFPTAANDAWDSVQWAAHNATTLGANLSKGFIVGGTSAGANLAAVASHLAADNGLSSPITGVFLSFGNLLHYETVPDKYKPHYKSWEQFKEGMFLDQRGMKWFYEQYKIDAQSPFGSPAIWPSGHKSQPPTYLQAAGMDPARDETLIYEHILREEAGVPTRLDVYSGLPHGATDFLPMLSKSKQALRDAKNGFEWLLAPKQKL